MQFQTIDPSILETLNLNEQRLKTIMEMVHRRQKLASDDRLERVKQLSPRERVNLPTLSIPKERRATTIDTKPQEYKKSKEHFELPSLPSINRERKGESAVNQSRRLKQREGSSSFLDSDNNSKDDNSISSPNKIPQKYSIKNIRSPREPPQSLPLLPDTTVLDTADKYSQILLDYSTQGQVIRKASSMNQLSSKDIYCMEIFGLVSKLTPVTALEDAEKIMKRIKKRHQHLQTFDKEYYLGLCQADILALK